MLRHCPYGLYMSHFHCASQFAESHQQRRYRRAAYDDVLRNLQARLTCQSLALIQLVTTTLPSNAIPAMSRLACGSQVSTGTCLPWLLDAVHHLSPYGLDTACPYSCCFFILELPGAAYQRLH